VPAPMATLSSFVQPTQFIGTFFMWMEAERQWKPVEVAAQEPNLILRREEEDGVKVRGAWPGLTRMRFGSLEAASWLLQRILGTLSLSLSTPYAWRPCRT
jgi:hypothetical protein